MGRTNSSQKRKRQRIKILNKLIKPNDNLHCHYCEIPLSINTITIDHVIPRSHKGPKRIKNLVIACSVCNSNKQSIQYEEFKKNAKYGWFNRIKAGLSRLGRIHRYGDENGCYDGELFLSDNRVFSQVRQRFYYSRDGKLMQ